MPRALHTIGLLSDADNSYTSLIDYIKPVLIKARATSDDVLHDAASAAKTFLDAAWTAGEARLLAAYKSSTKRSGALVGETFRGRVAFDEFKTSMKEASAFIRRFPRASLAMGLSAGHSSSGDGGGSGSRGGGGRGGGGSVDDSGGGSGDGGGGGGGSDARPGSRVSEVVYHTGEFSGCFSFSGAPQSKVYSQSKITAALKAKNSAAGKEACCLFAVARNKKFQHAWCKHMQAGETFRHRFRLTEEEQDVAGVVVGRLSAAGVPEKLDDRRDAADGGGDGKKKKRGPGFQRQAAGSAKRRV